MFRTQNFMKKKANICRKEIQFQIGGENGISNPFNQIINSDLGKEFGITRLGENHIALGTPLSSHEIEGEGLPTEKDSRAQHKEYNLNIDLRLSHDGNGNVEFIVAKKGTGRHSKFPLIKGLNPEQAEIALVKFEQQMTFSYIPLTLYHIASACYRRQEDDAHKRKEHFDRIINNFENYFRNILNRRGEKIVNEVEENGYKITTYERIEIGRNKGTIKNRKPSKREIENHNKRKPKILEAIREAINSENKSELAKIIGITRPTLQTWLKSIGIENEESFHRLIRFAKSEV